MGDDEPTCKVEYLDTLDGAPEETNWIRRGGKAKVVYTNGHEFTGTFDAERIKQGQGIYIWKASGGEDDDTPVEKARFEGNYVDGLKTGFGRMVFPNKDIYEGEWLENKIHGEGTYTYKKTGDIYSGSWVANKKNGEGRYEFGADSSILVGQWENGQIVKGTWELKKAGKYEGTFKLGKPIDQGTFSFASGLIQEGAYIVVKTGEEEEENSDEPPKAPNTLWKGKSIVIF